jgi:hypothetical protein
MTDEKHNYDEYQGWTNHETWALKLHLDNNPFDQHELFEAVKLLKQKNKTDTDQCLMEIALFVKQYAENIYYTVFETNASTKDERLLVQDVGSLWRVNWDEIAKAYFNEV